MILELKDMECRLTKLGQWTVEERGNRADLTLTEVFKIVYRIVKSEI